MLFTEALSRSDSMLTEGSLVERLNREPSLTLDPFIIHAGMIYNEAGRKILRGLYQQYLEVGRKYDLPFIVFTPTWRANPERVKQSAFRDHPGINGDAFRFLQEIRDSFGDYSEKVFIGGLLGCRGDAYNPREALSADEAHRFHEPQAQDLAAAGVDFLMAATLPALCEAEGLARALAGCGLPYVISFVLQPGGDLLDGTRLTEGMHRIDGQADPAPDFYMINCVHPASFARAMDESPDQQDTIRQRLRGFQGNTSFRSPAELDGLDFLDTAAPEEYAEAMLSLHRALGVKILGGCCGTDQCHIEEMAKRLTIRER